jgi:hypothetical protein
MIVWHQSFVKVHLPPSNPAAPSRERWVTSTALKMLPGKQLYIANWSR